MTDVVETPTDELPYWMRQARRRRDWGLLLAITFGILAAWPFVVRPGLPRTNASENYAFMTADYADSLREGRLYPRWSPNALGGLGAPIPHYHPPGAAYSAGVLKVLFTNDPVRAVRLVFIGAFIIAAAATYAFVRRRASAVAGLIATVLFVYNPYVGNIAPYVRGDLAECLALAFIPLLLWSVDRLLLDGQPIDLLLTTGVAAALLLTHPATAVIAFGLAVLVTVFHIASGRSTAWPLALVSAGLGITLAAFYWLPAFFERDLVQWIDRPLFEHLSLAALFAPLQSVDLNALLPEFQPTLGPLTLGLSILAMTAGLITRRQAGFHWVILAAAPGLIAAGIFALPHEVWLLGPISLCLAIGGAGVVTLCDRLPARWRRLSLAVLLTAVLSLSIPVLQIPHWPSSFGGVQPIDQIEYEQQGDGVAVLPPTFPLPLPLPNIPQANRILLSGYEVGNINKIILTQPASRTQINLISHESHRDRFQVQSSTSTPVSLLTAYFPGWQATAAGQAITIGHRDQTNLISFEIPPMSGELVVSLGPTPIRQTAWFASGGALLIVLLFTWQRMGSPGSNPIEIASLTLAEARLFSLVMIVFGAIVVLFNTPSLPVSLYERPGYGLDDAMPLRRSTNAGLQVLAYTVPTPTPHPGDTFQLTLYWQALRALPTNYQVQVKLLPKSDGLQRLQTDRRSPGDYPTVRWRTYLYVRDHYEIPLPDTLAPGAYDLAVEVFDCSLRCDPATRLTFFDVNGQNMGQTLVLPATVDVAH